ncbi:MAG: YdcF family protein [Alphaproteobacteria bacterium]
MTYIASKLFWYLAAPGNLLVVLLACGWLAMVVGARRLGHLLLAPAVLGAVAIAVLPIGDWLMAPLEARFGTAAAPERVEGIVVLGGALDSRLSAARDRPALTAHADRLYETAVLARRYPDARIVVTSGESGLAPEGTPEGPYMRRFLVDLGIADDRIQVESASRNTFENAVEARKLAAPMADQTWLLVTSAFHMPRAVGCFRRLGWQVVPYPVDYETTGRESGEGLDFNFRRGLTLVTLALKEWTALVAYRLLDRTDTLYPGP